MPKTFTFRESYELLQTNPKSFQEWLKKAGINPNAQVDKFDPRKKYLTREQLLMLAEVHGRVLPPLDDEQQRPEVMVSTEALADQLAVVQRQHAQRFEQIDRVLAQLVEQVQEVAGQQRDLQQALTQAISVVKDLQSATQNGQSNGTAKASELQEGVEVASAVITAEPAKALPAQRQVRRSTKASVAPKKKKVARGKKLPAGLVLLRDVASQHAIAMDRASAAGKSGKIKVVQGKWLVNSRWATEALDAQGQHDFFEVFHEREGFTPCDHCPHTFSHVSA